MDGSGGGVCPLPSACHSSLSAALSSHITVSVFVLTCHAALHLELPQAAPSIHHLLTSLHHFLPVTLGSLVTSDSAAERLPQQLEELNKL